MAEPSEKFKDIAYLLDRFGVAVLMCGFLAFMLWREVRDFKRDVTWKLERVIRNERAVMQKLGIPVILDGEMDGKK